MTGYELYLDGQRMDMNIRDISLTLKSNLLGEFGKIVAGYSQTLTLPRTVRNMAVLGVPEVPSMNDGKVRRLLSATLLSNGVEIVKDGTAVILSSKKDGYEIGITFGVVSFLQAVKDGGNLNDLPDDGTYVEWNANSQDVQPVAVVDPEGAIYRRNVFGFGEYDNGVNDTNKINVHPAVSCKWLMDKIEEAYGFTTTEGWKDNLADKYILLTEKRNSKTAIDESFGDYTDLVLGNFSVGGAQTTRRWSTVKARNTVITGYNIEVKGSRFYFRQDVRSVRFTAQVKGYGDEGDTLYLLRSTYYPLNGYVTSATMDAGGWWRIDAEIEGMVQGEWLELMFGTHNTTGEISGEIIIDAKYVWDEDEEPSDTEYGGIYPIIPNLPNIKMSDFIQMCGVLTGKWPIVEPSKKGVLEMVGVDDLLNGAVVDWSEKWDGIADSVSYSYLEAQRNTIQYKNDDDVNKAGVSSMTTIYVDDETLEPEKVLYEIPFSASQGNLIPQYSLVDGKIEESDVSERLLVNRQGNELWYDDSIRPSGLKATVLASYAALVNRPIVLKGTFRLTEIDIKMLSYKCRVYLRQMGRYYGIVQIQWKGDESMVELLQLPI